MTATDYQRQRRGALLGAALASCFISGACSGGSQETNDTAPSNSAALDPAVSEPATPAADNIAETATEPRANADKATSDETVGGDGSKIVLNTLTERDVEGVELDGELGCSFTRTGTTTPLLIAKGIVGSSDPAQGIVKVADSVERIAAPGGFNAMLKGVTFTGAGKTVRVTLTGAAAGGGESPPRPATLAYDRADGARRTIVGDWTCGP